MKNKCKVCGRSAESEYCFLHKPHKGISKKSKIGNKERTIKMHEFFLEIWSKRAHRCENCGEWLGNEPLSYMFDHVLEKRKHPDLEHEEENIMMLCLECHDKKTHGYYSTYMLEKFNQIVDKFRK